MSPRLFFRKPDIKKEEVRKSLSTAQEARVSFNLDFFLNKRLVMQMKGLCTELRSDSIRLYLRGEKSYIPPAGLQVHAYFTLRDGRRNIPHDFLCELIRTEKVGDEVFLLLSMPLDMGHNQRRNNVRIPMTKEDVPAFRLWFGKPITAPEGDGTIKLDWLPFEAEHVDMYDISAGGAMLAIDHASPLHAMITMREMILLGGDFGTKGVSHQLLLAGSVVRIKPDERKRPTLVGLRFKRWALRRDGKFHWMHLAPEDGVPPLGAWVFHIILSRGKHTSEESNNAPPPLVARSVE